MTRSFLLCVAALICLMFVNANAEYNELIRVKAAICVTAIIAAAYMIILFSKPKEQNQKQK